VHVCANVFYKDVVKKERDCSDKMF
jgi:hypothetical protein